jgi:glycosyltransferase involved in cell wall biosynthesis
MTAMEAFAVGVPVIAPDFGPFPYLVQHEQNGLLYTTDIVQSLSDAMLLMLSDTELKSRLTQGAKTTGMALASANQSFHTVLQKALNQWS